MLDHHRRLLEDGKKRSRAFHADCEALREQSGGKYPHAEVDEARKKHKIGPHSNKVEHNGPALMARLGPRWAA